MRALILMASCLILSSCIKVRTIPAFGSGGPDPYVQEQKEERAKVFGVFGQIVTVRYKLEKSTPSKCALCGMKTENRAIFLDLNGRDILPGNLWICSEHCVKYWTKKYVGFDIDRVQEHSKP